MERDGIEHPRSFWLLNATQFLGALNDNFFKLMLTFALIAYLGEDKALEVASISLAMLAIPFLFFSAAAGVLADRVSKRSVIVAMKGLELLVMVLGLLGFYLENPIFLYAVMFLMGTQSAIFSPSKMGIVPELTGRAGLSRGNGYMVATTYLAIIIGTLLAAWVSERVGGDYVLGGVGPVLVAIFGILTCLKIMKTPAGGTDRRASVLFVRDIWRTFYRLRANRDLLIAVGAAAYFLMLGAFVQINLIPYGIEHLGLTKEGSGYLFLWAALGIGMGAVLAGLLSGRNVELGVVPLGAIGLSVSSILLAINPSSVIAVKATIVFLGISAGLFIVPINAFIQFAAKRGNLGEVLAASNFLSWTGVVLAAVAGFLMGKFEMQPKTGFLIAGCLTLVLSVVSVRMLPDFLTRFLIILIVKFFYRIRVTGRHNIPIEGPALFIANHVSYVDALLIGASVQRRIRFVMIRDVYNSRLRPLFRLMGVIPISFQDPPKKIVQSLKEARQAMDDGFIVCIFAEGGISRSGLLMEFKGGFERILKGSDYPIIPIYLGGVYGSIFSYAHGELLSSMPTRIPYPVGIHFGDPLPATTSAQIVRQKVLELSADYVDSKKASRTLLGESFLRNARRHWRQPVMSDSMGKHFTFGKASVTSVLLGRRLRKLTEGQECVGLLLPTSATAALMNAALVLEGKVPVNLNYTASPTGQASAIKQGEIKTVITARPFLERLDREAPEGAVFLEDLAADIGSGEKVRAFLVARFLPTVFMRTRKKSADDLATVIFSSGSTGTPKGVMLSHHNILSNIEAFGLVLEPDREDNICSALPFFHSFGFTCTLWLPLISGISVAYHTNPLEGDKIAELVRENKSTILVTTPTFLLAYIRRAKPEDFKTLRLVATAAEKLKAKVADSFEKRFGIRPLEGYGATELSPVVSVNLPDVTRGNKLQPRSREGTVGLPVPGVAIKVVDPESGEPCEAGKAGLLLVKGPNVMRGYINDPLRTGEVLQDGWYNTGDIVTVDDDGFITITDRLSRFSKIAGEMVPQGAIEEVLFKGLGKQESILAVTSVPDDKKGERLVVLFTAEAGTAETLQGILAESDLPNLWKPSKNSYLEVEEIPILGTGKLDIQGLKELAKQQLGLV